MENLSRAQHIRMGRKDVKRRLANGEITLAEAMESEFVATMPIELLLCVLPLVGPDRAERILLKAERMPSAVRIKIVRNKEVGKLTGRERESITWALGSRKALVTA